MFAQEQEKCREEGGPLTSRQRRTGPSASNNERNDPPRIVPVLLGSIDVCSVIRRIVCGLSNHRCEYRKIGAFTCGLFWGEKGSRAKESQIHSILSVLCLSRLVCSFDFERSESITYGTIPMAIPSTDDFQQNLERAVRTLVRRDPTIRDLKRAHGLPTFRPHGGYFEMLVRSILSQQISGSAARTIIGRVEQAAGKLSDPAAIAGLPDDVVRSCGVSQQKLGYLRSLVEHVGDGRLNLRKIAKLPDDEIIAALTDVKGIGVWTAKMFLIFSLGRLDVLAHEDLGVRNGIRIAYGLETVPERKSVEAVAEEKGWGPYRSVACWYMWRAADGVKR